jgi:hypothetical protein
MVDNEKIVLNGKPHEAILLYQTGISGYEPVIGIRGVNREDVSRLESLLAENFGEPVSKKGNGLLDSLEIHEDPAAQIVFNNEYVIGDYKVEAILFDKSNRKNFVSEYIVISIDQELRDWGDADPGKWNVLLTLRLAGPPENYSTLCEDFVKILSQ